MKKIIFITVIILMMLGCLIGYSQEIHYVTIATVTWDPVTTLVTGELAPEDATITYRIYLRDTTTQSVITIDEISANEITFTYNSGTYVCGVSALIEYANGHKVENPDVTWSISTDTERVLIPFLLAFYPAAAVVKGMEYKE